MGSFDLFPSPKKLYAYFGLDPGVNDSGKLRGDRVHMSKRGSGLARRILHMIAINNLKMEKGIKTPVNPVIYDYYTANVPARKRGLLSEPLCIKSATSFSLCCGITNLLRSLHPKSIVNAM